MAGVLTITRDFAAVQPSTAKNRRFALCAPPGSRRVEHLMLALSLECDVHCDEMVPARPATAHLPAQPAEYRGLRAVTRGSGLIPRGYSIPLVGDEVARAERVLGGEHGD